MAQKYRIKNVEYSIQSALRGVRQVADRDNPGIPRREYGMPGEPGELPIFSGRIFNLLFMQRPVIHFYTPDQRRSKYCFLVAMLAMDPLSCPVRPGKLSLSLFV